MKNRLSDYKFSKIGTSPLRYLKNFHSSLSNIEIGTELTVNKGEFKITYNGYVVFKANCDAVFRQNIDCWLCMGFIIKKDDGTLIKILDKNKTEEQLIEVSKWHLLIDDNQNKLIDQHRKTIIIKLLTLKKGYSVHKKYTYEEILKHSYEYEKEILIKDEALINCLLYKWGNHE